MLFAGLSSAYIVLRGVPTWQNIALPSLLWPNTAVLLLSSITLELSQRAVRKNQLREHEAMARRERVCSGWFSLPASLPRGGSLCTPVSIFHRRFRVGFFYILTGLHGMHILGGIIALGFVLIKGAKRNQLNAFSHEPLRLCATYWHLMDALWVYLFLCCCCLNSIGENLNEC